MNGDEIRAARERRDMTQAQLAKAIGVGPRTVGSWERGETVPRNKMTKLRDLLDMHGGTGGVDDPIKAASDVTLLAELLRRATFRAAANG